MLQGIAKKTCDVLVMLNSFHSVVIDTPDLERGISEYQQLLDMAAPRIEVNAARQTRSALFSLQNMRLELRSLEGADAGMAAGEPRLAGIRLAGPRMADIEQGLAARGVSHGALRHERAEELVAAEGGLAEGTKSRSFQCIGIDPGASRGLDVELIGDEEPRWAPVVEDGRADAAAVLGLDHVVVFSAAPDSTRRFYEEGLGIRLALDRSFEERGVRLLFFRIGGATIEIGGRLDAEVKEGNTDRFGGLAWTVREIDAIAASLADAGVDVSEVRTGHKAGTRVCTVRNQTQGVPTLLIESLR